MKENDDALIEVLHDTIVKIQTSNGVGTGVWVGPGLIVTCAHVITPCNKEPIQVFWQDQKHTAKVVTFFDSEDIALLECHARPPIKHPIAILSGKYSVDDKLYSFGFSTDYPNGEPVTCSIEGTSNLPALIKLKGGQVVPGFSGAPILNRRTGAICGVLRRTRDTRSDLGGRGVPVQTILSAFPSVAEAQHEIQKAETVWTNALSAPQKMQLGIKHFTSTLVDRVAEIYTLLNYNARRNVKVAGQSVDIELERHFADIRIYRVVFVTDAKLTQDHLDAFAAKLVAIQRTHETVTGTIISTHALTADLPEQALSHKLKLLTLADLEAQLFDATGYINKLIRETESNPRYSLQLFIEPLLASSHSSRGEQAREHLSAWMSDSDNRHLTILGDVGIGKTFLSKVIAYESALMYRENPQHSRLPILIDLRNADRQFTLEGLVLSHFAANDLGDLTFDLFRHAVRSGRVLIILDGFDEMSAKVNPNVTARNFQELARIVEGNAKVILTCRTHYFKSRSDEEGTIYGEIANYGSESARELYWDLISRRGFSIAYLREFSLSQIEEYIAKTKGSKAPAALEKIKKIYNLMELCQRPMLLEMIVKSIGKINTSNISAAALYQVFTDAWIHRDKWRDVLSPVEKYEFLEGLAYLLTTNDEDAVHYNVLADQIKSSIADKISDPNLLLEIDNDVRTSTFLTRDEHGNYGFAHKSYREFFYARTIKNALQSGAQKSLAERRLSNEEIGFIVDLLGQDSDSSNRIIGELSDIITADYRYFVSENAFLLYIAIKRGPDWEEINKLNDIMLPDNVQLQSAKLNQLELSGLVGKNMDISGADVSESTLTHCRFLKAKAIGTDFTSSEMAFSEWENAKLAGSKFSNANLSKASLRGAELHNALFHDATLADVDVAGADLTGAHIYGTILAECTIHDSVERAPLLPILADLSNIKTGLSFLLEDQDFYDFVSEHIQRYAEIYGRIDTIEDVIQETWISLLASTSTERFLSKEHARKYVLETALRNLAKHNRHERIPISRGLDNRIGIVQDLTRAEKSELLLEVMESLSERNREILTLRLRGNTNQQVSQILDLSEISVRRQWAQISKRLRDEYAHTGLGEFR